MILVPSGFVFLSSQVSDGAESSKVQSLRLYGHTARVTGLAYLGFDQLASVSHDMTLRRWDISYGSQVVSHL